MTLIVAAVILRLPCPGSSLGANNALAARKDVTVGSSRASPWKRAWSPVPHLCEVLPEAVILRQRQVS